MNRVLGDFYLPDSEEALARALPEGWSYDRAGSFLKARSPDGRVWFVKQRGVTLCTTATAEDVGRTHGRLKLGEEFEDLEALEFWP